MYTATASAPWLDYNVTPCPGEGLLILCYHDAWDACLILYWIKIEAQDRALRAGSRDLPVDSKLLR